MIRLVCAAMSAQPAGSRCGQHHRSIAFVLNRVATPPRTRLRPACLLVHGLMLAASVAAVGEFGAGVFTPSEAGPQRHHTASGKPSGLSQQCRWRYIAAMTDVYPVAGDDVRPGEGSRRGLVVTVVASVLVLAVFFGVIALSNASSPTHRAIRACEVWVLGQLVSPASARFSGERFGDFAGWRVDGVVDSQNSFGAMLRSDFSCFMVDTGGGWVVSDGYVF